MDRNTAINALAGSTARCSFPEFWRDTTKYQHWMLSPVIDLQIT